jgi:TetR/AcrR family transcriptional regulator
MTENHRRPRLSAEERRKKIIEAARTVFLEQGFVGTRTREIAEEAGITEAFLYRFFRSKEAIYEAAVQEPMRELVAELLSATQGIGAGDASGREVLRQMNQMLARFMSDSAPFLATVWLRELDQGRDFYENELAPVMRKPLNDVLAKITGWHEPADARSFIFAAVVGSHVALAVDAMLRERGFDPRETGDQLTQLYSDGMPVEVQNAPVDFAGHGSR